MQRVNKSVKKTGFKVKKKMHCASHRKNPALFILSLLILAPVSLHFVFSEKLIMVLHR